MATTETTCQSCHQPLILDPSITNLSPSSYSLVAGSLPTSHPVQIDHSPYPSSSREAAQIWARHSKGAASSINGVGESFILLSDSVYPTNHNHNHSNGTTPPASSSSSSTPIPLRPPAIPNAELAANLHQLVSSKTGVSHPLCVECISVLQAELQGELDGLSKERDAYIAFEQGIQKSKAAVDTKGHGNGLDEYGIEGTQQEWDALMKRKKELEKEEADLTAELKAKEKELEGVHAEQEVVKRDEALVEQEEEDFLRNHAALSTQLRHLSDELESAKMTLLSSTALLAHLESTNVYNDAFQIGYTPLVPGERTGAGSYVGTINGLRLGGRPTVEWDEINAAWGHVALCVDRIAARVGFIFERFKIYPLGSSSRIDELPPSKQSYELYASPELSGFLHNRRFSHGLVALLDCIRQLVEFGQKGSRGWPVGSVDIRKDRISGYSIKLPGLASALPAMSIMGLGGSVLGESPNNSGGGTGGGAGTGGGRSRHGQDLSGEEQWTKACLAVLKVLKQVLIAESEADKVAMA